MQLGGLCVHEPFALQVELELPIRSKQSLSHVHVTTDPKVVLVNNGLPSSISEGSPQSLTET